MAPLTRTLSYLCLFFAYSHAFRALGPTVTLKGGVVMPSLGLGSAVRCRLALKSRTLMIAIFVVVVVAQ